MQLQGKKVAVLGLGVSGVASVELCRGEGASVVAYDQRPVQQLSPAARALGVEVAPALRSAAIESAEVVVVSPGVPLSDELQRLAARGATLVGELELAASFLSCPICAIGGTNGKSTTTGLVAAIVEAAGQRVFVGGNLGTPLASAAVAERRDEWDVAVVEVSSFQLEHVREFRPRVSVLLNITEDHLDRHGSLADYARVKGNAFRRQTEEDTAIGPFGDRLVDEQLRRGGARRVYFGAGDYRVDPEFIEERRGARFPLAGCRLRGAHNRLNVAAAIAAARALSVGEAAVAQGLARYEPLPHRLAHVARLDGVDYYDDSKATNVGAAVAAIEGLDEASLVLIAGGKDKGGSYEPLVRALVARGGSLVVLGQAAPLIVEAAQGRLPLERANDMREAVRRARALAQAGQAVLLSPACSSFDMYGSYSERGRDFAEAVLELLPPGAEGRA